MSHEVFSRQETPQGSTDRGFGLVFSAFFLILAVLDYFAKLPPFLKFSIPADECPYLLAHPELAAHTLSLAFLAASLIFLCFALVLPKALAPLNWLWTQFGLLLHKIVSPLVLGLLFLVAITPVGILMRLFGGDPLRLRFDPKAPSYWIERTPPGPAPETLKDQF